MKTVYDVIVIEDEPLARKKLEAFIAKIPELYLKATYCDALAAIEDLESGKVVPQAIFCDVQMPRMTGIEFVTRIQERNIPVVLTTAYEEYALKGYELEVVDYLLKPFSFDRFKSAVEKIKKRSGQSEKAQIETPALMIKVEHKLEKVPIETIQYIEGMKDYVRIHTTTRKLMTLMRLSALLTQLPNDNFVRIHKSYIVNTAYITTLGKDFLTLDEQRLPIGRSYKDEINAKMGI